MSWPSDINGGVPRKYRSRGKWVADPRYAGGGWWTHPGLGVHWTIGQLERLWVLAGGTRSTAPIAAAIAEDRESGGYSAAWNSAGATGLWQILWPLHRGLAGTRSRGQLFTPLQNARAAVALFREGGWSAWGSDVRSLRRAGQIPGYHPATALPAGAGRTAAIPAQTTSFPGLPSGSEVEQIAITAIIVLAGAGLAVWGIADATGATAKARRAASQAGATAVQAGTAAAMA